MPWRPAEVGEAKSCSVGASRLLDGWRYGRKFSTDERERGGNLKDE